eukprot:COSAG04_NODE_84_length_27625_cov_23.289835_7_plen_132_part_00
MDEGGCSRSPARPRAGLLLPLPLSCLLGCWRAVDWRGVGCVRDGDALHEPHELVSITQLGYNVGQHVGFAAGLPQHSDRHDGHRIDDDGRPCEAAQTGKRTRPCHPARGNPTQRHDVLDTGRNRAWRNGVT